MSFIYVSNIPGDRITLNQTESRHLIKVLRSRKGDRIELTDGKGYLYEASITKASMDACQLHIHSYYLSEPKRTYNLHIAIAPPKNINRFEWFVEKATEIGVDEITPLYCDHSERNKIRIDRLNNIIMAAIQQSRQVYKPQLNELTNFHTFLLQSKPNAGNYMAHCHEATDKHNTTSFIVNSQTTILIGPEGDFSKDEVQAALNAHFLPLSFGDTRLRTETAGIMACSLCWYKSYHDKKEEDE